jgi:hypothetical protein
MPMLTASTLLSIWEHGLLKRPIQSILDLLSTAYPDLSLDQLMDIPIGQRDTQLLSIREVLFGPHLNCLTLCPKCGEQLETTFDIDQVRVAKRPFVTSETHSISSGGYDIQFRLPNSSDMQMIENLADAKQARRTLFERCVQDATQKGAPIPVSELLEETMNAIAAQMAEIDPQADVQISLNCPACSQQWFAAFDIASFLWIEINSWATRILEDVHRLASAYGWSEADILALSPVRRQLYLEMIG